MTARPSSRARRLPVPPAARREWAYFFDIDGTLVAIAATPASARPGRDLRRRLEDLHVASGGAVALISGRAIADIDRLFHGVRFPAAGQHGLERRGAAGTITSHAPPGAGLEAVRDRIAAAVSGKRGLLLEHKGLSLALHYRRAPQLAGFAHRTVRSQLPRLGSDYAIQTGKRVVEMRPTGKDKGAAVLEFMAEKPFSGRTPVFVGDDATDEYGFATVNRLGGYSIKVGPGRTAARWRLPDVKAVERWLRSI